MYKPIAIVTSLLNATVMGVLAYRTKDPKIKAWHLSKMDWMEKYVWNDNIHIQLGTRTRHQFSGYQYPPVEITKIAEALMTLDVYLRIVQHFQFNDNKFLVSKVKNAIANLSFPITDKLASLDESYEHTLSPFFQKVQAGIDGSDTVDEALAWILIRGASCLPEFGTPENWGVFETRVKIVLGRRRAKDQSKGSLFSMAARDNFVTKISQHLGLKEKIDTDAVVDVLTEYDYLFRDTDPPDI
jgi:hypothetical protein